MSELTIYQLSQYLFAIQAPIYRIKNLSMDINVLIKHIFK